MMSSTSCDLTELMSARMEGVASADEGILKVV